MSAELCCFKKKSNCFGYYQKRLIFAAPYRKVTIISLFFKKFNLQKNETRNPSEELSLCRV